MSAVSIVSLAVSHSLLHLCKLLSNTGLVSGLAVGAAQNPISSYSYMFLPPVTRAVRTSAFSFVGALNDVLYILQTQSLPSWLCELNLYSWWEGLGSSSLVTPPLGFTCGFISTSACGPSPGVCSWGCPGGLVFAPVRANCGTGAAPWIAGVLAVQVLRVGG